MLSRLAFRRPFNRAPVCCWILKGMNGSRKKRNVPERKIINVKRQQVTGKEYQNSAHTGRQISLAGGKLDLPRGRDGRDLGLRSSASQSQSGGMYLHSNSSDLPRGRGRASVPVLTTGDMDAHGWTVSCGIAVLLGGLGGYYIVLW